MGARERFCKTSRLIGELHNVQLAIMYEGDDWRPDEPRGVGVGKPTENRAIFAVDEWEEKLKGLRKRESELIAYIGVTLQLISAVRDGLGDDYADILEQRYIDRSFWRDVSVDGRKVPRSTGALKVSIAFDWIDSIGISRLLNGETEI